MYKKLLPILGAFFILLIAGFDFTPAKAAQEVVPGPRGGTIAATTASTITIEAPSLVIVPFVSKWQYPVRVTNYTAVTQTVTLVIDAPKVNSLETNVQGLGSCSYTESHKRATCTILIAPVMYWDISTLFDLGSNGEWEVTQCISTGECKKTRMSYPIGPNFQIGYLPQICNGCTHGATVASAQTEQQSTVLPLHAKGESVVSSGVTTVTFWICMELTADQIQWGDAVHLSDMPAEPGVPQLVSTRFTPALEFNITQVPTTVCTKATQAGAREFDARVERGGKFATYIGFYTALPIGTTTTVVDPNPIRSNESFLIASLSQLTQRYIPSIKVGTGSLEIHSLFVPDGGKCQSVTGPVGTESEKSGTTDITVQELISAPTYAPYSGQMKISIYRYQTDFEGDIVIPDMSVVNVAVTGPTCNSSSFQEIYLPAIRAIVN